MERFWLYRLSLLLLILGATVGLCIFGVVIADWDKTRGFESRLCSGEIERFDPETGGICCHGTVETWMLNSNGTREKRVELYYPSVNWLIVCEDCSKVRNWAAGLSSADEFECLLDNPEKTYPNGVSSVYDKIAGYFVGLILFGFLIIFSIVHPLYQILL